MSDAPTILEVSGPFREPREPVFSYDYAIQRPQWPTAHAVRIKVSIPDELDYCKAKVLGLTGGSPGQQLMMNQLLSRAIADRKFQIANEDGRFAERSDVMVAPFTGPLQHLFPRLESWMHETKAHLQAQIAARTGLKPPA